MSSKDAHNNVPSKGKAVADNVTEDVAPSEPSSSQMTAREGNQGRRRWRGSWGKRGPQDALQQRQASEGAASSEALRLAELITLHDEAKEQVDRLIIQIQELSMNVTDTAASSSKTDELSSEHLELECWLYLRETELKDLQQKCERAGYDPVLRERIDLNRRNSKNAERNVYSRAHHLRDMPPQYPAFLRQLEAADSGVSSGDLLSKHITRDQESMPLSGGSMGTQKRPGGDPRALSDDSCINYLSQTLATKWTQVFSKEIAGCLPETITVAEKDLPNVKLELSRALKAFSFDFNPNDLEKEQENGLECIRQNERRIVSEILSLTWRNPKKLPTEPLSKTLAKDDPSEIEHAVYIEQMRTLILRSSAFNDFSRRAQAILSGRLDGGITVAPLTTQLWQQNPRTPAIYSVNWDPTEYMKANYDQWQVQSLMDTITVTRSDGDALQALTCAEYLIQTWPLTGLRTVRYLRVVLKDLVENNKAEVQSEQTKLKAEKKEWAIEFCIESSFSYQVDFGAQIAWLGAACRSYHDRNDTATPMLARPLASKANDSSIDITYEPRRLRQPPASGATSNCWMKLFRGLSVADGFPVRSRGADCEGIEMTVELMTVLGQAPRAVIFDGRLVLKGYSSMFVAIRKLDDGILWHLLTRDDENEEMPYSWASTIEIQGEAKMAWLEYPRHFVGWADQVHLKLGTRQGEYDIRQATTPVASFRPALTSATVSVSKIFGASTTIVRGKREALQLKESTTYRNRIRWLSRKRVVIYDDKFKRAWLQSADRVLLHILRCRIKDNYGESELFSTEDFLYAESDVSADVPKLLLDSKFCSKKLDEERGDTIIECEQGSDGEVTRKETWKVRVTTVKTEIDELLDAFRRMNDYLERVYSGASLKLRGTDRPRLEGWSFQEVVDGLDNIPSRAISLNAQANGWVDFCNTTQLPVLIGGGFGELIAPDTSAICPHWESVPADQDYLVAPVHILLEDIQKGGEDTAQALQLTDGIYWHQSDYLFETCLCKRRHNLQPCNRVQELYSGMAIGSKKRPLLQLSEMPKQGAVIFGRPSKFDRIKKAFSGSSRESVSEMPALPGASDTDEDSGLGTLH